MSNPYDPRPHPGGWAAVRSHVHRRWTLPFHFVEWLTRLIAFYLSHWSLLEVLEYTGRFTVLVAVIVYFMEAPDRRKQKQYQAWQVINSASGKRGNGGRRAAMEELNEDHVSLVGIDVSDAFLQGLRLPDVDLHYAIMSSCDFRDCNLEGANLWQANLAWSNFRDGNLRRIRAQGSNFSNADMTNADLSGADLSQADLREAEIAEIKWNQIADIRQANIFDVQNAPKGFVEWAMKHGAVSFARKPTTKP